MDSRCLLACILAYAQRCAACCTCESTWRNALSKHIQPCLKKLLGSAIGSQSRRLSLVEQVLSNGSTMRDELPWREPICAHDALHISLCVTRIRSRDAHPSRRAAFIILEYKLIEPQITFLFFNQIKIFKKLCNARNLLGRRKKKEILFIELFPLLNKISISLKSKYRVKFSRF